MNKHFTITFKITCAIMLCLISATVNISGQRKAAGQKQPVTTIDSTEIALTQTQGVPVSPFRDTLFLIHGTIGSYTAQHRAEAISKKIKNLEEYLRFQPDSLKLVKFNDQINIIYDDQRYEKSRIIISIDTLQAKIYGRSKTELASSYKGIIINAINKEIYDSSWKRKGIQALSIILIIAVEYFFIRMLRYGYRRLRVIIRRLHKKRIKGFFRVIGVAKEIQIIFVILKLIKYLLIFISLGACILFIFKLFPYTTEFSDQLLDYIIPSLKKIGLSIKNYMPNLFTIIIIVVIFMYVKKFLRSIAEKVSENKITFKGFYPDWAKTTYNVVIGVLTIFTFILIYPYLPGSDSQVFQGVSVFVGLVISLGSTNLIGNLIAGLVITYMRPFKAGDRVKMDDCVGNIIEKTALVTRVKTAKNEIITIPNSSVMSTKTVNYTFSANQYGLILYTTVAVGYDIPWRQVHELLLKVAYKTDNLNRNQKPFIMQSAFNDFYVEYQLNVFTKDANRMNDIYSDLRKNILDVFDEAEIDLIAPHYRINKNVHDFYEDIATDKKSGDD